MKFEVSTWQNLPEKISPIAFSLGSIPIYWYGLMYVAAFLTAYFLVRYRIRKKETDIPLETVKDFFPWMIISLLLGARLGDVFVYNWTYFKNRIWEILLPFDVYNHWQYIGIYGMSYFGGVIGVATALLIFTKARHISSTKKRVWNEILKISDLFAPAIPLAYAFGRLGNFINGELWGRATNVPWGMYFPADITGQLRHPSQLYEMFLEGFLLFAILWILRKKSFPTGYLTAFYLIGYGAARFAAEFFRQPDNDLFFLSLTIGQWFSIVAAIAGILIISRAGKTKKLAN